MNDLIVTVLVVSGLGALLALLLFVVAKQFKVEEDPRIDEVEKMLPGANCGGCGFPGCRGMSEALVKNDDISSLYCPVGGAECMKAVANYLGKAAAERAPMVAVVRCAGSCENRPKTNTFDGAHSCLVASSLYAGDTGCSFGCLGLGDCVAKCEFDALHINPATGLPEVDEEKWRKIYVSCVNKAKGAVARKACKVACIGCGKCAKVCAHDAITVENNLAYIDSMKCKMCRKCVVECPTGAIVEVGFPARKVETPETKTAKTE